MKEIQLAKKLYLSVLKVMKKILDLQAFKMDRKSQDYKYMKSQIMDYFYDELNKIFRYLENNKILQNCDCGTNVRKGWTSCPKCAGSGYCNYKK